jgi:DNA gyrase/topoisomerase IV subunit B
MRDLSGGGRPPRRQREDGRINAFRLDPSFSRQDPNVEKNPDRTAYLANNEIKNMVTAIRTRGLSGTSSTPESSVHTRIICMTDADVDWLPHPDSASDLLLLRYMRPLIDRDTSTTPSPRCISTSAGTTRPTSLRTRTSETAERFGRMERPRSSANKGLGEMNPEQLWNRPWTRKTAPC